MASWALRRSSFFSFHRLYREKGMKKLQKRFQAEKEQLHAQFVAERNTEYNGREVQ